MIEADCTTFLVECIASSNTAFSEFALAVLLNLAPHDDFRPVFGAAGGIKCFISLAELGSKPQHITLKVINVLCLCCRESVNRIKIRELGGISLLMKCVQDASMSVLYNRIISSFLCFLYDEASVTLMLENSVIDILVEQMRKCTDVKTYDLVVLASEVINQAIHREDEDFECEDSFMTEDEHANLFHENTTEMKDDSLCNVDMRDDTIPTNSDNGNVFVEKWIEIIPAETTADVSGVNLVDSGSSNEHQQNHTPVPSPAIAAIQEDQQVAGSFMVVDEHDIVEADKSIDAVSNTLKIAEPECAGVSLPGDSKEMSISGCPTDVCDAFRKQNECDEDDARTNGREQSSGTVETCPAENTSERLQSTECVKYSIDSPSYEHTEWDYTEYYKGAKCKTSFSADPSGRWSPVGSDWGGYQSDPSPQHSSMYSPAYSSPRSSYSPLSNSSFVSPSVSPFYGPTYSPPSSPDYQSSDSNQAIPMVTTSRELHSGTTKARIVQQLSFSPENSDESNPPPSLGIVSFSTRIPQTNPSESKSAPSISELQSAPESMPDVSQTNQCAPGSYSEDVGSIEAQKSDVEPIVPITQKGVESTPPMNQSDTNPLPYASINVTTDDSIMSGTQDTVLNENTVESLEKLNSDQEPALKAKPAKAHIKRTIHCKHNVKPVKVRKERTVSDPLSVLDASDSELHSETSKGDLMSSEKVTVVNILTFISVVSHVDERNVYLLNTECIDLLLSYITQCSNPARKAWRILIRLARNPNCFEKLMEMNVPLKVFTLLGEMRNNIVEFLKTADKPGSGEGLPQSLNPQDSGKEIEKDISPFDETERYQTNVTKVPEHQSPNHSTNRSSVTMVRVAKDVEDRKQRQKLTEEFLQTLVLIAEGRYGQEVILHRFKSGTEKEKWNWAINVMYLCR
jgi:hypothetical protein